jgi:hypothetical protein
MEIEEVWYGVGVYVGRGEVVGGGGGGKLY